MRGKNNTLIFEEDCIVGSGCSFWLEGNNNLIHIGQGTTFTLAVHLNAQENNTQILIGKDCMFSNSIIVRTSDSHPIYNENNDRINPGRNIYIGNHVWLSPNSKVFKGATIGDGSIIGSDSLVTRVVPSNCLAVGHPVKIVKKNIKWTREPLF